MKRKSMVLVVLLLAIGFAAISTTLYINGTSKINPNQDDFNVYFSDAYVNETQDLSVITDDTHISFTTTFEGLGQEYILDYEVTNGSKNYDAELEMSCTSNSEYLTVTNEFDTENILIARDSRLGRLSIKQTKSYAGDDLEVTIECIIDANAQERDSLNEAEIQAAGEYVIEGYYVDENNNPLANNNLVIFSDTPHYVTTNEKGYVFYNGLERGAHEIYQVNDTLDNIKTMSKEEIKSIAATSATFTTKTNNEIVFDNDSLLKSLFIEESKKYCESIVNKEWTFSYVGKEQDFLTRCDGDYKFELWGAQGGSVGEYLGGNGAYTSGNITLNPNNILNIYVGEAGNNIRKYVIWNNGTTTVDGKDSTYNIWGASGGGSTDIRLVSGEYNSFNSLKSRIMVAAGGGGAANRGSGYGDGNGGAGGGLEGYNGETVNYSSSSKYSIYHTYGATQISGGYYTVDGKIVENSFVGGFGIPNENKTDVYLTVATTGGNGYYGGSGYLHSGSSGGSSFISGHTGCNAIAETSTSGAIKHTGSSEHYSGYIFTDTKMVDGQGYNWTTSKGSYTGMPSHDGTTTIKGNQGNGYAKITYLGTN